MSVDATFRGGPCDGEELALIGGLPPYLMMMRSPASGSMEWIVVGAGFDDDWPDSHRYVLDVSQTHLLTVDGEPPSGEAVYRYEEP